MFCGAPRCFSLSTGGKGTRWHRSGARYKRASERAIFIDTYGSAPLSATARGWHSGEPGELDRHSRIPATVTVRATMRERREVFRSEDAVQRRRRSLPRHGRRRHLADEMERGVSNGRLFAEGSLSPTDDASGWLAGASLDQWVAILIRHGDFRGARRQQNRFAASRRRRIGDDASVTDLGQPRMDWCFQVTSPDYSRRLFRCRHTGSFYNRRSRACRRETKGETGINRSPRSQ